MCGDIRAIKKDCAATYCAVVAHHHACKRFLKFLEQSALTEPHFRRQHVIRDKSVRFLKGYSGNAGGRAKDESKIDKHILDFPDPSEIRADLSFLSSII